MIMNEDYRITDSKFGYKSDSDLFGVEILKGEFAGVHYTYGTLNFPDDENGDGSYTISFDYDIREKSELVTESNKEKFEQTIGDVLNSVLLDSLQEAERRYKNEIRNEDSEAPVS